MHIWGYTVIFLIHLKLVYEIYILSSISLFNEDDMSCHITVVDDIDGLVQDCSNSTANALELMQSCTKPSIYQ